MNEPPTDAVTRILAALPELLPTLEASYKDIHAHPALSMQEVRTACATGTVSPAASFADIVLA